jgi:hypothetical protein
MFRNVMYEFDPSLSTYKEPREKGAKSAWCYSKDAIPIQIGTGMSTHERFSFGHLVILFSQSHRQAGARVKVQPLDLFT